MSQISNRPYRSALYVPGSKPRALVKAAGLDCDAVVFDLEDAITPDQKGIARKAVVDALAGDYGRQARIVRVNGLDTAWGADDLRAISGIGLEGVLIPKVANAAEVSAVAGILPNAPVWAMIETPIGVLNVAEIAAHPSIVGIVVGTNDLQKDMHARFRPDRGPLGVALGMCVLAAKAHGRVVLDGVYNAFTDAEGLRRECEQGRDMGFDGKTVIHPDQIGVANLAFAPTADELDLAMRQIVAFENAADSGQGVAVLDGRIVEALHVEAAHRTIAMAAAIRPEVKE